MGTKSIAAIAGFAALLLSSAASAESYNSEMYYRLATDIGGAGNCLDVVNGGPDNNFVHLAHCANYSGQYWLLSPIGDDRYRLTTAFRGRRKCLDVVNGGPDNNRLTLADCGNYAGQFWRLVPSQRDDGAVRLSSEFRSSRCVEIRGEGDDAGLTPCTDYSGQYWFVAPTLMFVPGAIK